MKRKMTVLIITVAFAASLGPIVFAGEAPASATAKPAASYKSKSTPGTMPVMGKVVNAGPNAIEINEGAKNMTFIVNAKTVVLEKGKPGTIPQIAKDSQVKIRYAGNTAKTIELI